MYSEEECLKDGCNHEGQDNDSEQIEDDKVNSSPAGPSDNDMSLEINAAWNVMYNPTSAPP